MIAAVGVAAALDAMLMLSLADHENVALVDRQALDALLEERELGAGVAEPEARGRRVGRVR